MVEPFGLSFAHLSRHLEIVAGLVLLQAAYLFAVGPLRKRFGWAEHLDRRRAVIFSAGVLVMAVAVLPPLHDLAEEYLFSAHMVQHLLLIMAAAPLLLAGTPDWLIRPLLRHRPAARLARFLTFPLVAFVLSNVVLDGWHVPALFDAAVRHDWVHGFQHVTLVAGALLMWWPVLSPVAALPRLSDPLQMLYLFLLAVAQMPLFAILTFSDHVLYSSYADAPPLWGMSPLEDQLVGGILMKVGSELLFMGAIAVVFLRWFSREEAASSNAGRGGEAAPDQPYRTTWTVHPWEVDKTR